jgi:hypothetical protein
VHDPPKYTSTQVGDLAIFLILASYKRWWVGGLDIFFIFGRQLLPIQALCLLCLNTSSSYTHSASTQPVLGRWSSYLSYLWQATPSYSVPVFALLEHLLLLDIHTQHLHNRCWVGGLAIFLIFGRQLLPIQALCLLCLKTSSSYTHIIAHNTSSTLSAHNSTIIINN